MKNIVFTENTLSVNDQVFPVTYTIDQDNSVHAHVTAIENGEPVYLRIFFAVSDPHHAAALAAAMQTVRPEIIPEQETEERPETIPEEQTAEAQETPAEETSEPEQEEQEPERDPKKARGEVPEKLFAGLEITGKGWKILFDKSHERTRVIFQDMPSKAVREAVKKAGFYWSPVMESWNKKLTFRAFRAAQALAVELRALCG